MDEEQGKKEGQEEPKKEKDKKVSRRKFIVGAGIAGGTALVALLFRDKIGGLFAPPGEEVPPEKPPSGGEVPPGEEGPPPEGAPTALEAPEMPPNMLRPYLKLSPVGLTHGSGGTPDVLDLFVMNNGNGSSTAFFDVYQWIAPAGHGVPAVVTAWSGHKNVVLANGGLADIFPLSFPGDRCIFVSREMIALPPGAAVLRQVSINYDWDGVWCLLGDPILDPCGYTVESADAVAAEDFVRKHLYCGV